MRALVTGTRMPTAIDTVRKLGRDGDTVFAADSFASAPGSRSRFVEQSFIVAPPAADPTGFGDDVADILKTNAIDRVLPTFEEVFYLAWHRDRLAPLADLFLPDFETLKRLHNKIAFLDLARDMGLPVHPHLVATNRAELAEACGEFPRYIAHPAYSRGAIDLYTNDGPLAGDQRLEDCSPTVQNPYLVQPFVPGEELCTNSIAHNGRITGHVAYTHPLTMEHGGGIAFETVDAPETIGMAQQIVEATGFHGQISLDFMRTDAGLVLIECNPRPTSGMTLLPDEMFTDALNDRQPDRVLVGPAGVRRRLTVVVLRNMLAHPSGALDDLRELMRGGRDIYTEGRDIAPLIFQLLSYGRILAIQLRARGENRVSLLDAYLQDILWDGQPLG